jgi:membrane protein YdbS with pleckstrin-like domain
MNPTEPTTVTATMNSSISEQNYPVSVKWVWARVLGTVLAFPFYFLYGLAKVGWVFGLVISLAIITTHIIVVIMQRKYYHYELGDQYITIREGVIKRQERHIPYGVIQNVSIKRSLTDRIFGLATLNVQNAVQQGQGGKSGFWKGTQRRQSSDSADGIMGSSGTDFNLPGQLPENAEALQKTILEKMKQSPDWGMQAGL